MLYLSLPFLVVKGKAAHGYGQQFLNPSVESSSSSTKVSLDAHWWPGSKNYWNWGIVSLATTDWKPQCRRERTLWMPHTGTKLKWSWKCKMQNKCTPCQLFCLWEECYPKLILITSVIRNINFWRTSTGLVLMFPDTVNCLMPFTDS